MSKEYSFTSHVGGLTPQTTIVVPEGDLTQAQINLLAGEALKMYWGLPDKAKAIVKEIISKDNI